MARRLKNLNGDRAKDEDEGVEYQDVAKILYSVKVIQLCGFFCEKQKKLGSIRELGPGREPDSEGQTVTHMGIMGDF